MWIVAEKRHENDEGVPTIVAPANLWNGEVVKIVAQGTSVLIYALHTI